MEHPQLQANELIKTIKSDHQGKVRALRYPAKFNDRELKNHSPALKLGEHKDEILKSI